MSPSKKPVALPPLAEGSEVVRLPRLTSPAGRVLQLGAALLFASYFFLGLWGGFGMLLLSPRGLGVLSWRSLAAVLAAYVGQLVCYKPHKGRGWKPWLLYSPLSDYVLHYYDSTVVREGPKLDPKGHYLFAYYPHGVYGVCRAFSGGAECWNTLFPGITARWGSFGAAFYLPGIREFSLSVGCLDAGKKVLERTAKRGENIVLLPGGIDEMMLTDGTSTNTQLVMTDRKGYAKLAIEQGMDIIPGFCFGEKWIHKTVQLPGVVQRFCRRFRLSGTLLKGRGATFLGFLGIPLGFVYGKPVSVKQQYPVDQAYLDEIHGKVEAAITDIFSRYKESFGYGSDETLTMVAPKASLGFKKAKDQ